MCLSPRRLIKQGNYVESTYKGEKGTEYFIDTYVKCGYCEQCVNEKANNWVIRNIYESKQHKDICFITLTYKDNPIFLIKKHFQDFMKRLRRYIDYHGLTDITGYKYKINKKTGEVKQIPIYAKVRMFLCGEYGSEKGRPHGHILIYGWKEKTENLTYMGINKKGNIILKSEMIQKLWGMGRTTYQIFNENEIPYITLYETAKEETARYYRQRKEEVDKLIKRLNDKNDIINKNGHRALMIKTLERKLKEAEKNKEDYISIKEFNLWSKALGWEMFEKEYKEYNKNKNYDWTEYVSDKEFFTPSPWIKKLANKGDEYAIKEMLRRAQETSKYKNAEELRIANMNRRLAELTKEKIKWIKDKDKIEL